ncbi:MAG: CvpA family protein [Deltaproteobacteria bacterium]|nr:CvpA family protein [Deltaproteobacteria bacterium]
MNILDLFMLGLLGWGLVRGYFRGIISETSSILGVVAGFWAARHWYVGMASGLAGWVKNPESAWVTHPHYPKIVAFLAIFFSIYFIVSLLGWGIKTLARVAQLGWMDRMFGALFGLLKGSMQCSIILLAFTVFSPTGESVVLENSKVAPRVTFVAVRVAKLAPADWRAQFLEKLETLKVAWQAKKTGT